MPGMRLRLPRAGALLVALGVGLNTNFLAKYRLTSVCGRRWRLKCTSIPRGMCGHRVCISCRFIASRDAGGAAAVRMSQQRAAWGRGAARARVGGLCAGDTHAL